MLVTTQSLHMLAHYSYSGQRLAIILWIWSKNGEQKKVCLCAIQNGGAGRQGASFARYLALLCKPLLSLTIIAIPG